MHSFRRSTFSALIASIFLATAANGADVAKELKSLTGAPTRLVWCQATTNPNDFCALTPTFKLCGFDTEDNAGEHYILSEVTSYAKPLFTPDGQRVVYSNRSDKMIYVVNWDGSGKKKVVRGYASDVWCDPVNGITWIYYRKGEGKSGDAMMRCRLDDPNVKELVWDQSRTGHDNTPWFQLSADGKRAGDAFPWSACGVASLSNKSWKQYGGGCWPSMAPDNSYRFFHFLGDHKTVAMFDADGKNRRVVWVNGHENIHNRDVYFPQWTNSIHFMTVTGPGIGGHQSELYIGKFDQAYSAVEKWVRVTFNDKGDFYGDAWIKGAETAARKAAKDAAEAEAAILKAKLEGTSLKVWPGNTAELVFLWENSSKSNQIILADGKAGRTCRVTPRSKAVFSRYFDMDLAGGSFVADGVDAELLDVCRRSNQLTIESVVTSASLQQSGPARIVTFSSDPSSRNFTLGQDGNRLILRLRTPQTGANGTNPQIDLCTIEEGKTYHIIVSYLRNLLTCYVNGEQVLVTDKVRGDFSNWGPAHLLFGDEWTGDRDWHGQLEGVAIYSRFIDQPEARKHWEFYSAKVKNRQPLPKLAVQAKLVKITPTPKPQDVAPYRRCLVDYVYEIEKVLDGKCAESRIMVSHWGILDAKVVPINRTLGKSYRLNLEEFEKHPELDGERRVSDIDDYDLTSWYDIER